MDGWMDGWLDGWMAGWLDGWMAGWLDGWMDGWMDGSAEPENPITSRQFLILPWVGRHSGLNPSKSPQLVKNRITTMNITPERSIDSFNLNLVSFTEIDDDHGLWFLLGGKPICSSHVSSFSSSRYLKQPLRTCHSLLPGQLGHLHIWHSDMTVFIHAMSDISVAVNISTILNPYSLAKLKLFHTSDTWYQAVQNINIPWKASTFRDCQIKRLENQFEKKHKTFSNPHDSWWPEINITFSTEKIDTICVARLWRWSSLLKGIQSQILIFLELVGGAFSFLSGQPSKKTEKNLTKLSCA